MPSPHRRRGGLIALPTAALAGLLALAATQAGPNAPQEGPPEAMKQTIIRVENELAAK